MMCLSWPLQVRHLHKASFIAITVRDRECLLKLDMAVLRIDIRARSIDSNHADCSRLAAGDLGPVIAPVLLIVLTPLAPDCRSGNRREQLDQNHADRW